MANVCPLLIQPSLNGHTYHDLHLKFNSSTGNCSRNSIQNLFLIEFTRIINSTYNYTSYNLYDLSKSNNELTYFQVYHDDHVHVCVRSIFDIDKNDMACYEFYMITVRTSIDAILSPLFILFIYILILLIAILFSLLERTYNKLPQILFSGSITKKIVQSKDIFSFMSKSRQQWRNVNVTRINEKKEILKVMDLIAKEYQSKTDTTIIKRKKSIEHIDRMLNF